jgi:peptide/nickel transport system permease protein
MLQESMSTFRSGLWTTLFPGAAITSTVVAFNLVGDGLNDALNPILKER